MSDFEFTGELGQRAQERLRTEQIAWLTTVRPNGIPEPNPIWFHWDGSSIILRSEHNLKVRNIGANPHVALNFNSNASGVDIIVIRGLARIGTEADFDPISEAYFEKYAKGIEHLGTTPERMAQSYSVIIVIEPTKLRGF